MFNFLTNFYRYSKKQENPRFWITTNCRDYNKGEKIKKYEFIERIGSGSFGIVYEFRDVSNNNIKKWKNVIAKISANNETYQNEHDLLQYIDSVILKKKQCPNFLELIDSFTCNDIFPDNIYPWNIEKEFILYEKGKIIRFPFEKQEPYSFIIIEKAEGGNIQNVIKNNILFPFDIKQILFQLLFAVHTLNKNKIYHRDISANNIVYKKIKQKEKEYFYILNNEKVFKISFLTTKTNFNYMPCIIDYGSSQMYSFLELEKENILWPVTTLWYRAPEQILTNRYVISSDVFSLALYIIQVIFDGEYTLFEVSGSAPDELIKTVSYFLINQIESPLDIANQLWSYACAFNLPTDDELKNNAADYVMYEKNEVWLQLLQYRNEIENEFGEYGWIFESKIIQEISDYDVNLIQCLQEMLSWSPSKRKTVEQLLNESNFFDELKIDPIEKIRIQKNKWGFVNQFDKINRKRHRNNYNENIL